MTEELLKHTKSLSPLSLKAIDAKVISDGKNIYMVKKDENEREYRALIEKDKGLYLLLTKATDGSCAKMQFISAYVSSKCNLNCQVCYERCGNDREAGLEEIKELLVKHKDCIVAMTGMEPTCREDIFELIKLAGNRASLITNGIKLKSLEYVKKLKSHGLKKIFFSFNGLNDEIYRKMNGGNLLEAKLKALKNIGLEKIDTLLSATLARDINEDQILPLVELCFENRSFILELRIRTLAQTGKHLNSEQICVSELIELVADSLNVSKTDIFREFCFIQAFIGKCGKILPKGFRDKYGAKLCSFIFHIKKDNGGGYSSPGSRIDLNRINKSLFKSMYFFYYLIKAYGPLLLMEIGFHILNLPRFVVQKKMLNITLKCWPNLYNIDLTEMNKCPSVYYKNGEIEKFCVSNIKNSIKKKN